MNFKKIESFLITATQILLIVAIFSPLVSKSTAIFPYTVPAVFFFQLAVILAAICYTIIIIINTDFIPRFSLLTIIMTGFFVIQAILTFTSVEPLRSFMGSIERMTGFWNLFHYYLFFIITVTLTQHDKKLIRKIIICSLIVSTLVAIQYVVLQINPRMSIIARYAFGNPGFIANYLTLHIPLLLFLLFKETDREKIIGLGILTILFSGVIITSANRAAFLGWLAAILIMSCYFLLKKKRGAVILGIIIVLFISIYGFVFINRNSNLVKNTYFLSKITNLSLKEETIQNRFIIWRMAWKGFLEKPVFGWGRENFQWVFEKNYNPQIYTTSPSEPWYDRAHNIIFDELIAGGIINLLAILTLLTFFIWQTIKRRDQFVIIFTTFIIVYGIQLFFTLDTLATYLPLFIGFSLITASTIGIKTKLSLSKIYNIILRVAFFIILIIFIVAGAKFTAIPAFANLRMGQAFYAIPYNFETFKNINSEIDNLMLDQNSYKQDVFLVESFHMQKIAGLNINNPFLTPFEEYLISILKRIISKNPRGFLKLSVYTNVLLSDFARRTNQGNIAKETIDFWDLLIEKYPSRPLFLLNAVEANRVAGNLNKAIELMQKTISIVPLSPNTKKLYWVLGNLLRKTEQTDAAIDAYIKAIESGYRHDDLIQLITTANFLTSFEKGLPAARDIYLYALSLYPNNADFHANLAYIYGKLGEKTLAIQEVRKAEALSPGHKKDIDKFIKNLEN